MSGPRVTVVNIFSVSYSGGTWVNLLLGSHPDAAGIGEGKRMLMTPHPACSLHLVDCPLFSSVDPAAEENLFLQIARLSGKRILIVKNNSRKLLERQEHPDIRRVFIHLVRDGRPTVASYIRKNGAAGMWRATRWWVHGVRRDERLLARQPDGHVTVRYEDLQADAPGQLQRLCAHVGMEYTPAMLEYWNVDHHFLGGNVGTLFALMRKRHQEVPAGWQETVGGTQYKWDLGHYQQSDPAHFEDERWKTELTPWQRRLFGLLAGRTNRRLGYPWK